MTTDTAREAPAPLDIAHALAPRIRERAAEIEAARRLLVMEIARARLFKVAVARAEGSTGRCLAMGINTFRQSAQFGPEVHRKLSHGETPRRRPNGDQEVRIAYFHPKSGARIIDTWDVSGMRGTAATTSWSTTRSWPKSTPSRRWTGERASPGR